MVCRLRILGPGVVVAFADRSSLDVKWRYVVIDAILCVIDASALSQLVATFGGAVLVRSHRLAGLIDRTRTPLPRVAGVMAADGSLRSWWCCFWGAKVNCG